MQVSEIITRDVETIPPTATIREAAQRMRSMDVGSLPVCDGTRLLGMITDRDITVRAVATGSDPAKTKLADICSHDIAAVRPDQTVDDAVQMMKSHDVKRVLVMDDSKIEGIVSLGDLSRLGKDQDVQEDISRAEPNN